MDDLISRQAVKDMIKNHKSDFSTEKDYRTARACVNAVPSSQPKTGEWIIATGMMPPEFHGHHICSECCNFANMEPPFGNREDLSKFCPYCGAKMRGADDE